VTVEGGLAGPGLAGFPDPAAPGALAGPTYRLVAIPGDGVGPDVVTAAKRILAAAGERFDEAVLREVGIGLGDGVGIDEELLGQRPDGGENVAGSDAAGDDGMADLADDLLIDRGGGTGRDMQRPHETPACALRVLVHIVHLAGKMSNEKNTVLYDFLLEKWRQVPNISRD